MQAVFQAARSTRWDARRYARPTFQAATQDLEPDLEDEDDDPKEDDIDPTKTGAVTAARMRIAGAGVTRRRPSLLLVRPGV